MNPLVYACGALALLAGVLGWSADRGWGKVKLLQEQHKTAVAKGVADALQAAAKKSTLIAVAARKDHAELLTELRGVGDRSVARVDRFLAQHLPEASCAPGQARVDAWNEVTR